MTNIKYNKEALDIILSGINKVCDATNQTIGPLGGNAEYKMGDKIVITNDAGTIAPLIKDKNPFIEMGCSDAREVAQKSNLEAGDGRSTALCLLQSITSKSLSLVNLGANSHMLKKGMEDATENVINMLKDSMTTPVDNADLIKKVATISADSEEIGSVIFNALQDVGKNGIVTVEESTEPGISYDVVKGLEFEKGYISEPMINNKEKMESEYFDVPILIVDADITLFKDELLPILQFIPIKVSEKRELVIIANSITGDALKGININHELGGDVSILAIQSPGYAENKSHLLEDIAVTVGATVIKDIENLKTAGGSVLGKAARVVSTAHNTTIIGGEGNEGKIQERVNLLKSHILLSDERYGKEMIEKRIAQLDGGIASIYVGGTTHGEMTYLRDKTRDSLSATRGAIEEGVITGGGVGLILVGHALMSNVKDDSDYCKGYKLLLDSLSTPLEKIIKNSGRKDFEVVKNKIIETNDGYDVVKNKYVGPLEIIDSVKVICTALKNASSKACSLVNVKLSFTQETKEV